MLSNSTHVSRMFWRNAKRMNKTLELGLNLSGKNPNSSTIAKQRLLDLRGSVAQELLNGQGASNE